MRKSLIVKLVLLNSVLAFSGCHRKTCDDRDRDKDPETEQRASSCTGHSGRSHHHGGIHLGGFSHGRSNRGTSSPVTRGGFGGTGRSAS